LGIKGNSEQFIKSKDLTIKRSKIGVISLAKSNKNEIKYGRIAFQTKVASLKRHVFKVRVV